MHRIGVPGGKVTLGVGPGDGSGHGNGILWFCDGASFGGSDESVSVFGKPRIDEFLHELENAGVGPLVLTEGFEIHEKVDERAA